MPKQFIDSYEIFFKNNFIINQVYKQESAQNKVYNL